MATSSGWVMWGGRRNKVTFLWRTTFVKVKRTCDLWPSKSIKVGSWSGSLVIPAWRAKWLVKVFKHCTIWPTTFTHLTWGSWWCSLKKNRHPTLTRMKYGGIWLPIAFPAAIMVIADDLGDVTAMVSLLQTIWGGAWSVVIPDSSIF